jgi:signal transduction histidine kinase
MSVPAAGPSVLFIDDEENILRALNRLFMDEPYSIITTSDPEEMLRIVERENLKVIISDQRMPKASGVDLLARSKALRPHALRILFTGYADIQATQDAINKGEVYRYISKPWDDEGLKATVRDAIRVHDLAEENRELLALTQAQNADLVRTNAEVRKLLEKEKAFSSTVSHELRTPLSAIKMAVDLIRMQTAGKLDEQPAKFLDIAGKNVDRLARLVNDILSLTRLEAGAESLSGKPDDLNRIVRECAEVQGIAARNKGLELVLDLDPALPEAWIDADKMHQVLNNLLNNAVKFTGTGSVTVATRRSGPGAVECSVRDTGRGMPEADLERIFEKFCQLGTAQERVGGTGLGLSICREIVERHGGKLWAGSEPGKGSIFTFRLPLQPKGEVL